MLKNYEVPAIENLLEVWHSIPENECKESLHDKTGHWHGDVIKYGYDFFGDDPAGVLWSDAPNYFISGLFLSHALMMDRCCKEWGTDANGFFRRVWEALRKEGVLPI